MKPFCKSLILGLSVVVVTLLPISKSYCQSPPEAAVVISIAKFDEQMADIKYVLTASGFPEMNFIASGMIKGYTKGIDNSKPAGVLLYFAEDAEEPDFVGLIPVSNIDDILDIISNTGQAEIEEGDNFTTIIAPNGEEVFVKESEGYALFSNKDVILENLPASPAELIKNLTSEYNFSAQVFGQRIPKKLRDNVLKMIRESSEQTFDNLGEGDLPAQLQRQNFQMQMKQMEMMFEQTDRLTIGIAADQEANSLHVDVVYTATPGSELAKKLAENKATQPTQFSGFLMEGATFTQNGSSRIAKDDADEMATMLDDVLKTTISEMDQDGDLSEEDLALIEKSLDNLIDVAKATLAEGILDTGVVLMLEDGEINFAMGAHVADPQKIEETVKELAEIAEQKLGDEIEVALNSGSHKNVTFHQFVIQVPDDQDKARDVLGDQFTLLVGIGQHEVYLAAGSSPEKILKQAMDGTQTVDHAGQINLYIAPILKFAASVEDNPAVEAMADALAQSGNDRIGMTSDLIENGIKMRFELQDGILGLIKVGYETFNNMNGQGFGGIDDDDF